MIAIVTYEVFTCLDATFSLEKVVTGQIRGKQRMHIRVYDRRVYIQVKTYQQ